MKLYPIFKTLFGYAQMADEPIFGDLQFNMYDLVKLEVERGECDEKSLESVTPGVLKENNTMFCFPTPRRQDSVSESQLRRLKFIVDHQTKFEKVIKDFIAKMRLASNPYFSLDYPIERCIGNHSTIIPYEDDSGIYVSFAFSDRGDSKGVMVVFHNWDDIRERDVNDYPKLLGKRGSNMD